MLLLAGFVFIIAPEFAFAHAAQRGHVLLLPTQLYIAGGAVVVALTFIFMVIVAGKSVIGKNINLNPPEVQDKPVILLNVLSLIAMIILVWIGFKGSRDPLSNLLPLTIWVVWWIGLTMATVIFGNIWHYISPWPAMEKLISYLPRIPDHFNSRLFSSSKIAYWPAVILFFCFAWLELIHPSPMDPDTIANIIMIL